MDREAQIELIKSAEERAAEALRQRMTTPTYRAFLERYDDQARGANCAPERRLVRTA